MINPLHVQTVREVVRSGSFADAARNLGYTASAVSQQVAALERASGVVLFERRARSIRPTNAAFLLVRKGNDVLSAIDSLQRELRALASGDTGLVRLGSFPTASARILPRALAELTRAQPGIEIKLSEGEPDELLPELLDGDLDAQLVYRYSVFPRTWPDQLLETPLMEEELLLLVPESHRLADADTIEPAELSAETWIASRTESAGAQALLRLCGSAGFTPDIAFRSNDYAVVCGLVACGLGIALVPALGCAQSVPGLRRLRLDQTPAPRRHVTVLQRTTNANPLMTAVLRELEKCTDLDVSVP